MLVRSCEQTGPDTRIPCCLLFPLPLALNCPPPPNLMHSGDYKNYLFVLHLAFLFLGGGQHFKVRILQFLNIRARILSYSENSKDLVVLVP